MKTLIVITTLLATTAAAAQQPAGNLTPRTDSLIQAPVNTGLSVRDCLGVLAAMTALDGGKNGDGKPFRFTSALRNAIAHNIFMLSTVQLEAQAANRRAQDEIRGDAEKLSERQLSQLEDRLNGYLDRPCKVEVDRLRKNDLDLERNDVSPSTIAAMWKVLDQ
jgi:hypothetical protein